MCVHMMSVHARLVCVDWLEMERWPLCHLLRLLQVQGSNSEGDGSPYPSVKVTNYNVNNNSVRGHTIRIIGHGD